MEKDHHDIYDRIIYWLYNNCSGMQVVLLEQELGLVDIDGKIAEDAYSELFFSNSGNNYEIYKEYREYLYEKIGKKTIYGHYLPEYLIFINSDTSDTFLINAANEIEPSLIFELNVACKLGCAFADHAPEAATYFSYDYFLKDLPSDADYGLYLLAKYYIPWLNNKSRKHAITESQYLLYLSTVLFPQRKEFRNSTYLEQTVELIEKAINMVSSAHSADRESIISEIKTNFNEFVKEIEITQMRNSLNEMKAMYKEIEDNDKEEIKNKINKWVKNIRHCDTDEQYLLISTEYEFNKYLNQDIDDNLKEDLSYIIRNYSVILDRVIIQLWKEFIKTNEDLFLRKNEVLDNIDEKDRFWRNFKLKSKKSNSFILEDIKKYIIENGDKEFRTTALEKYYMLINITDQIYTLSSSPIKVKFPKRINDCFKMFYDEYRNRYMHGEKLKGEYAFKEVEESRDIFFKCMNAVLSEIGKLRK